MCFKVDFVSYHYYYDRWQLFVEMSVFTVWCRPVSETWPVWVVALWQSENLHISSVFTFCLHSLRTICVLQHPLGLLTICLTSFISWELSLLIWLFIFSFCFWVDFILRSTIKDRKKQTKPPNIKNIWSPRNLWTKKY